MKAEKLIFNVPRRIRHEASEGRRRVRRAERRARLEFKRAFVPGRAV